MSDSLQSPSLALPFTPFSVQYHAIPYSYHTNSDLSLTIYFYLTLQTAESKNGPMDLMDFPQIAATAHAIDERGAEAAMKKKAALSALIGEHFYAVHAKAQKRVPLPEGLDLDTPFSALELQKVRIYILFYVPLH